MSDIVAGDTVELKSGGVPMAVEWVEDGQALCVWQDGTKALQNTYGVVVLRKIDPDEGAGITI